MKKSIKQMVGKRIVSVILSALLAVTGVGLLPQFAMPVKAVNTPYNINLASVQETFSDNCTIQITGDGTVTDHTIDITVAANKTVTVELSGVNIDVSGNQIRCAFNISGAGNVVINLEGTNTLKSGLDCAGLQKNNTGALTITGSGTLYAYGGDYAAGIGGRLYASASNIQITGGTIIAFGGTDGAGIGGGMGGNGTNIEITGGTVMANGGSDGAGIGGGYSNVGSNGNGTNISISGGTVYAIGGMSGAGIGGGMADGSGGTASGISISGASIVYVAGGQAFSSDGPGAAIGSGGQTNNVSGDEYVPDTTGLTTGRIEYYAPGTFDIDIIYGTVQPVRTIIGSGAPSAAPLLVDCMQEVMDDINAAMALGGEQTVTIRGYSALSSDVMELLAKNPQITVVSEFSFDGLDYKITIPGSAVKLNPAIEWYGPKYLFPMFCMYGTDTAPAMQAFLEKYAEEIR